MQKKFLFLSTIFLALTSMPVDTFAGVQSVEPNPIVENHPMLASKITGLDVAPAPKAEDVKIKAPEQKQLSEREKQKLLQKQKKEQTKSQQEICNDTNGAKWKSGKCVCTASGYTWDPQELECVAGSDDPEDEKIDKDAEKVAEKIKNTPAVIGSSISFSAEIANHTKVRDEFWAWKEKCEKDNKSMNIEEVFVDTKGSNAKKLVKTCAIKTCKSKYTKSKDGKSCVINESELGDEEKSFKEACEKTEKGKWVISGNTSTCVCPKTSEGYFFDKELKKCIIDSDENCPVNTKYNEETKTCEAVKEDSSEEKLSEEELSRRAKKIQEAEDKYKAAKENEQSTANKTLTATTTAAMGIGGMELAMGLSEQKADKDAEADMKAYLETFRCSYAEGKSVKGGSESIELPGGNDDKLMSLRNEYIALAADLKERKEALGMKPGIESEKILDKFEMGLYDDENVGITSGNYASLYRAQALGSEEDQAKIDAEKEASSKRVKGGAIAVGVGAGVGILGNSLLNGKLGEALKNIKKEGKEGKATKAATKIEEDALKSLQSCLDKAGVNNTDKLTMDDIMPSAISVKNVKCKDLANNEKVKGKDAVDLFADFDANDVSKFLDNLIDNFGGKIAGQMIGVTMDEKPSDTQKSRAKTTLENSIKKIQKRFEEALEKDKQESKDKTTNVLTGVMEGLTDAKAQNNSQGGQGGASGAAGFDLSSLSGLIKQ